MMRCHAFRKIFDTTCIEKNVNHYVKEKLLGHTAKLGLDVNYFRPTESQLLDEYLKVVDDLTVDESHRLQKQVQELKQQDDYQKYVIDKKIKEMEEQNKILNQKLIKYEEHVKYTKEWEQKIDLIVDSQIEERNINREYESIPVNQKGKKDSVFKNLMEIREKRIKHENDYENLLREHVDDDDDYY
jgi:hypothetical protein